MRKLFITIGFLFLGVMAITFTYERAKLAKTLDFKIMVIDEDEKSNFNLYLLNNENLLSEIRVHLDFTSQDIIGDIFKLYTSRSNTLPLGFYSPVVLSSELHKYNILEDRLIITVSDDFFRNVSDEVKYSLAWTFKQLGYEKVIISNNQNTIELNYQDYLVFNNTFQKYSFEKIVTIFYHQDNSFFPKTYECKLTHQIDYIYYKLIDYFELNRKTINFDYQLDDERVYINLIDETSQINQSFIESFKRTISHNISKDVVIIKNQEVFS